MRELHCISKDALQVGLEKARLLSKLMSGEVKVRMNAE
jgi:hypothetical protein